MKLLRQSRLFFQEGRSDKVYEVDLAELDEDRCVVNFRYGRRGTTLREGTKTKAPVSREEAEKIFDRLVASKRKKGYRSEGEPAPAAEREIRDESDGAVPLLLRRLETLAAAASRERGHWRPQRGQDGSLERTVWRLGERREQSALAPLVRLTRDVLARRKRGGDAVAGLRYCLAWSLGRIGQAEAADVLDQLALDDDAAVRRIAAEAMRAVLPPEPRAAYVESVVEELPAELAMALRAADEEALWQALETHLRRADDDPGPYLVVEQLYLADDLPAAREVVLRWCENAPFAPPAFQRLRHLYKMAEFRLDPELFGLLAHRIEKEPAGVNNHGYWPTAWIHGGYVRVGPELEKERPLFAFSSRTKDYLRLRSARTLRRLGQLGDDRYVDLAVGTLLPFDDGDADRVVESIQYDWMNDEVRRVVYPPWSPYLALNLVLHRNSPRFELRSGSRYWSCRAGQVPDQEPPAVREEAFPDLWDRRPEALVQLLLHSRCAPVHDFAARAVAGHRQILDALGVDDVAAFLRTPYVPTQRLGLDEARRRYDTYDPDLELVRALFDSPLDEARALATEWVVARPQAFLVAPDFVLHLLFHSRADVRATGTRLVEDNTLPPKVSEKAFFGRLVAALLALEPDTGEQEAEPDQTTEQETAEEGPPENLADDRADRIAREVGRLVSRAFPSQLRRLGLDVVRELVGHPLPGVQELGARALLDHETPPEDLPADLFEALLASDAESVRAYAVQLVGRLPDARLVDEEELILGFCLADAAPVRQAVRPILARLAPDHPGFAAAVAAALAVRLMRKERHPGLHADLLAMVSEDLEPVLSSLSADLAYRLLRSASAGAHRLGARLLLRSEGLADLSVRKIALLAQHEMNDVRDAAWKRLAADLERTREHLGDVLVGLDGEWAESRQQGFTFLRENFGADDWTPTLLVSLCDSVRDDVRQFGRDLIQRFFDAENGADYLLKLSQHPAADIQLFATHYLERFASGRPERIAELTPYFTTVLSAVYRGRVAKDRIFAFLRDEARDDRRTAEIVLPLLHRISLTVAVGDRAEVVEILNEIRHRHPDLETLLQPRSVEFRPPRHGARLAEAGARESA